MNLINILLFLLIFYSLSAPSAGGESELKVLLSYKGVDSEFVVREGAKGTGDDKAKTNNLILEVKGSAGNVVIFYNITGALIGCLMEGIQSKGSNTTIFVRDNLSIYFKGADLGVTIAYIDKNRKISRVSLNKSETLRLINVVSNSLWFCSYRTESVLRSQ